MPYKIVNVDDGYKVCKKDNSKCFSKEPLTLEKAEAQLKAIGINSHLNGGAKPINQELYNKIKDEVYKKYPKHSLFRSSFLVKQYLKEGGKYEGEENNMNIKKWFKQNWISANDYLRDKIVKCGEANTQEDYNEYPLCRPKAILDKLTKPEIKKMVDEKNKIGKKQLKTKDILGTDKYNIKPTITGTGKQDILKNLSKIKGLYLVGSAKRGEDFNDLDFITENDLKDCFELIKDLYNESDLIINGSKYIKIKIGDLNVDIWKAKNKEELKTMIILRTIDKGHLIGYKKIAKENNYKLSDKGLFKDNERIDFKSEKQLRKLIGLGKNKTFENQLKEIDLNTEDYLNLVKIVAEHRGYNPNLLKISDDGIHKMDYDGKKFGRVGYNDKIIYSWLEKMGEIPKGTTKEKYTNYRKRSKDIMIKTNNKYSPASLSYYLLW